MLITESINVWCWCWDISLLLRISSCRTQHGCSSMEKRAKIPANNEAKHSFCCSLYRGIDSWLRMFNCRSYPLCTLVAQMLIFANMLMKALLNKILYIAFLFIYCKLQETKPKGNLFANHWLSKVCKCNNPITFKALSLFHYLSYWKNIVLANDSLPMLI